MSSLMSPSRRSSMSLFVCSAAQLNLSGFNRGTGSLGQEVARWLAFRVANTKTGGISELLPGANSAGSRLLPQFHWVGVTEGARLRRVIRSSRPSPFGQGSLQPHLIAWKPGGMVSWGSEANGCHIVPSYLKVIFSLGAILRVLVRMSSTKSLSQPSGTYVTTSPFGLQL